MFNNDSWEKLAKEQSEKYATLQDELILKINYELAKDLDKPKEIWLRKRQLDEQRIAIMLERETHKYTKDLIQTTTQGLEVSRDEAIKEVEKVAKDKVVKPGIPNVRVGVQGNVGFALSQALTNYRAVINKVALDPDDLFTQIQKATREQIDSGFVVYQNGRKMSYKSYMEMRARTDLNNNALKNLETTSTALGVGYYLASEHFDCADDHAQYQGKFYLGDGTIDEWNGKYMYLSEAKSKGFLTRPNCRHYVTPITKDQLGKVTTKDLNMQNGHYEPENYATLQEQRKNERVIRKYKNRLESDTILLNQVKDPTQRAELLANIKQSRTVVSGYQLKQRELLSGKPVTRDYRREKTGIIVNDMGAKYRL
jgi:hypothetical protein